LALVIFWTDRALRDLEAIRDFIARDNIPAADRWVARLIAAAEQTASAPLAARQVPEIGRSDVRELLLRSYRIVCRVSDGHIAVLTVFEGHRLFPTDVEPAG
jgi:plasmid stabilization system protein ParE